MIPPPAVEIVKVNLSEPHEYMPEMPVPVSESSAKKVREKKSQSEPIVRAISYDWK